MGRQRTPRDGGQDIIKNMALFWDSQAVRWRGNRAVGAKRLMGRRATAKRGGEVNFWEQTGIYALYTADYKLIYVGQAGLTDRSCIGPRIKAHLSDGLAGRWKLFSWFGLQKVRTSDNNLGKRAQIKVTKPGHLANVLEGIVIEVAEPPMNNQRGRFGRKVERYLQIDEGVKPEQDEGAKLQRKLIRLENILEKRSSQIRRDIAKK